MALLSSVELCDVSVADVAVQLDADRLKEGLGLDLALGLDHDRQEEVEKNDVLHARDLLRRFPVLYCAC